MIPVHLYVPACAGLFWPSSDRVVHVVNGRSDGDGGGYEGAPGREVSTRTVVVSLAF